jgi:D-glycerate 3-kinase
MVEIYLFMNSIVLDQISKWLLQYKKRPLMIGINGPQGAGKTTLVNELQEAWPSVVSISLDDFYIPFNEQILLKGNPLLEYRGLPGTHSVELLLDRLRKIEARIPTSIPKFDKSLRNGRGDRLSPELWTEVVDALIEGWSLGFQAIPLLTCDTSKYSFPFTERDLIQINQNLKFYDCINQMLDCFFQIKAQNIDYVYTWRWQQEETMKQKLGGKVGLSFDQVRDFVHRFMPIYDIYLPQLEKQTIVLKGKSCCIEIDLNRNPIRYFVI